MNVDGHVLLDPTIFILISIHPHPTEQIFTEAGVISIEHADFDGIERLAAVTGMMMMMIMMIVVMMMYDV